MAYIRAKKKNEKIVSYEFSCFMGRDGKGKQIRRSITWHVPKELSQSKAEKAARKAAELWEEEVRAEYEKDLQNPKRTAIKEVANEKTRFEDFVNDIWFPICIDNGEHKISTISFYRQTVDSVISYFSGYSLQGMNVFAIKKFFVFLKKEKAYSAQYRHHHYRVLNMVFDFAVKQGVVKENPMENVAKPKLERKKVDALSKDEAKEFFDAVNDYPLDFRCMIYLLTTAGLRRGECVGLKWCDFNEKERTISIERNVVYSTETGVVVNTPKTEKSVRTIPLLKSTAYFLHLLKMQRQRENPEENLRNSFLFHSKNDIFLPMHPDAITRRLKRFVKSNNLPDMSPHDLRHSCATLLLGSGADIKSVQEIMGHVDARTTLNYYVKTDINQMRDAVNKYEKVFDL